VTAPQGTTAVAGVPAAGIAQLSVDGSVVWKSGHALRSDVALHDGYLEVSGVSGTTTLQATAG
jgi:hypothetical protein